MDCKNTHSCNVTFYQEKHNAVVSVHSQNFTNYGAGMCSTGIVVGGEPSSVDVVYRGFTQKDGTFFVS